MTTFSVEAMVNELDSDDQSIDLLGSVLQAGIRLFVVSYNNMQQIVIHMFSQLANVCMERR